MKKGRKARRRLAEVLQLDSLAREAERMKNQDE
jgi:hypothetical protein